MKKSKMAKRAVRYANAQKLMIQETTHNNYFYWLHSKVKQAHLPKSQKQRLAQDRAKLKEKKKIIKKLTQKDINNIADIFCKSLKITNSKKYVSSIKKTPFNIFISLTPTAWKLLNAKVKKDRNMPETKLVLGLAVKLNYKGESIPVQLISTRFLTKDAKAFSENIMSHETSHSITTTLTKRAQTVQQQFLDTAKDEIISHLYEPYTFKKDRRKKLTDHLNSTRRHYEQTGADLSNAKLRSDLLRDLVIYSKLPRKTLAELLRSNSTQKSIDVLLELQ
jgi:hypothetical protein